MVDFYVKWLHMIRGFYCVFLFLPSKHIWAHKYIRFRFYFEFWTVFLEVMGWFNKVLRMFYRCCRNLEAERGVATTLLDWFRGFFVFVLWIKELPPSIMVTRNHNWSFRDSKVRDWLRKGKVLTPLIRPT
jgi:hypothetical protein